MIDTPIAEEGFVGAAFGAAWMGERPIVELQFADFVSCAFDPIVTLGAKTHWRSGIRLPARDPPAVRAAAFAAGRSTRRRPRAGSAATAGLKVVAPAASPTPTGCCGARSRTTIRCSTSSTRRSTGACATRRRTTATASPIGRARVARSGSDVTIVTYGSGVDLALRVAEELAGEASVEVVDLRTLWPLDARHGARVASRARRALLVLQEAARSIGVASAVAARSSPREGFELLDAPPAIHAPIDTPVPFAPELEDAYLPSRRLAREGTA